MKLKVSFPCQNGYFSILLFKLIYLLKTLVAALDAQFLAVHAARQVNMLPTFMLR